MPVVDNLRYTWFKVANAQANKRFQSNHPDISFPPDYLIYESFQLDHRKYYEGGAAVADWLWSHYNEHTQRPIRRILDWGCGPARVVRHMPSRMPNAEIHACDYNGQSIAWCQAHIANVKFKKNNISPPLPYPTEYFDAVYGISILTHLSEVRHEEWIDELGRITSEHGTIILTTHGRAFLPKLTAAERARFGQGLLVVRPSGPEGHRVFSAFQPPQYLKHLFSKHFEVIRHIEGRTPSKPEQDVWILTKRRA